MRLRERLERLRSSAPADACEQGNQEQLQTVRQEADDLLSEAARAIDHTLSANSEAFLTECIQEGGQ